MGNIGGRSVFTCCFAPCGWAARLSQRVEPDFLPCGGGGLPVPDGRHLSGRQSEMSSLGGLSRKHQLRPFRFPFVGHPYRTKLHRGVFSTADELRGEGDRKSVV